MTQKVVMRSAPSRRGFVKGVGGMFGVAVLAPAAVLAQQPNAMFATPPSVITNPPRSWGALRAAGDLSRSGHRYYR